MEAVVDTDVVIIGYGPSGVSAANVLGSNGVRTIAFERHQDIYARARAVTVNDWTLRCFQSVGLADRLIEDMDETYALRTVTYDGQELTRLKFPAGDLGYATSYSIYQPVMEQTLRDGAARFADHVDVRFGFEVTDIEQHADHVIVTATHLPTGKSSRTRARYALACDGGSSMTRERLGITLLGDTIETKWVIIDARVKRWWPDRHVLTFWSDKKRPVVDIALSLGNHRWELPLGFHESEADFATEEQLWRLLSTMGVTREDVDIHQHAFYKHHVRRAERWRDGRVFLVGDAAHLMPPWAGQGMQSGIRDAFNICWKLTEVLRGTLPATLLDSYESERAPNVERYTQISVFSGRTVKQQLAPEEMAMLRPPPDATRSGPAKLPPSLQPPELYAGWVSGDTGPGSAVGKFIPQPRVATPRGRIQRFDTVIGNGFTMLGDNIDPSSLLDDAQRAGWDRLGTVYRALRSPDQGSELTNDIIDLTGSLLAWMRGFGAKAVAVRPDRFVAAADTGGLSVPGTPQ